jgi:RNA polymerase sigma-70 factor (ECF subfamily)
MDDRAPPDSVEALVRRSSAGDRQALQALLERHLPALRAWVRLRAGPQVRAHESQSDIVQSVCRELLEGLAGLEWRGEAAFRAWLFTAAVRKLVERQRHWQAARRDAAREQATPSGMDLAELYGTVLTPSRVAMAREDVTRLEAAFDELTEEQRDVLLLARVAGLSRAEIAERLGRTEDSVRNLLHRATARLALRMQVAEG